VSRAARQAARGRGRRGEWLAALWLRLKGFRILARGLRTPAGEVDLIARRGRLLIVVEVKARGSLADALAAITARQRARISRAAEIFLQRNPALADCDLRFDAVLIVPGQAPRHVIDAWRGGDRAVNT
jgi:putative endonuclease